MSKRLKIIALIVVVLLAAAPLFLKSEKDFLEVMNFTDSIGVKTRIIKFDSNEVVYVKCKFKNSGGYFDAPEKLGLSAVVSSVLFSRVGDLSLPDTARKFKELGITGMDVSSSGHDFEIAFLMPKSKSAEILSFLSTAFVEPAFTKRDLEYVKRFYPDILDVETSSITDLTREKIDEMLYENGMYGVNLTGSPQTISGITIEDVEDFIKTKFTRKNLKMTFGGSVSKAEAESYTKILFEKISEGNEPEKLKADQQKILLGNLSEQTEAKISKPHMEDVVGILTGIRLDGFNKLERAATTIIVDALFSEFGDFIRDMERSDIIGLVNCRATFEKYSGALYLEVVLNKKDVEKYKKFLAEKLSEYQKKINLRDCRIAKKNFEKLTQSGFIAMNGLDYKLKMRLLPFAKVDDDVLKYTANKLFDKKNIRTVVIGDFSEVVGGKNGN